MVFLFSGLHGKEYDASWELGGCFVSYFTASNSIWGYVQLDCFVYLFLICSHPLYLDKYEYQYTIPKCVVLYKHSHHGTQKGMTWLAPSSPGHRMWVPLPPNLSRNSFDKCFTCTSLLRCSLFN